MAVHFFSFLSDRRNAYWEKGFSNPSRGLCITHHWLPLSTNLARLESVIVVKLNYLRWFNWDGASAGITGRPAGVKLSTVQDDQFVCASSRRCLWWIIWWSKKGWASSETLREWLIRTVKVTLCGVWMIPQFGVSFTLILTFTLPTLKERATFSAQN